MELSEAIVKCAATLTYALLFAKGVDPSEWKLGAIVLELEEILGVKAIICNHKMIGASLLFGNFLPIRVFSLSLTVMGDTLTAHTFLPTG